MTAQETLAHAVTWQVLRGLRESLTIPARLGTPGLIASFVRGGTDGVWVLVVLHLLPGLRELLVRSLEELTRATHALEARVVLQRLTCQGEAVARVVERLTRLAHTLQRRVELVRRLGHDVVVLTSLRQRVHEAWHAYPMLLTPVPPPLPPWTMWPWASCSGPQ
jgi:hypothetical protein